MKKIIKLLDNHARLGDYEPFLLPDDNLILSFEHKGYDLTNAFITLRNGEIIEKFKFKKSFEIPKKFLFVGDLYIKVEMFLGGEKAKQWITLPIRIRETETNLVAFDLLNAIEKKLEFLEKNTVSNDTFLKVVEKLNEVVEKQNELAETVSSIKEDNIKIEL